MTKEKSNVVRLSVEADTLEEHRKLTEELYEELYNEIEKDGPVNVAKQHNTGMGSAIIIAVGTAVAGTAIVSLAKCLQAWLMRRKGVAVQIRKPDGMLLSIDAEKFDDDEIVRMISSLPGDPTSPPDV